jgi:large subunit ribosomal protein L4
MATLKVIDLSGKEVGSVDVDDSVFAAEVKEHLLWEVVRVQRAAKRQSNAHTKTRSEVSMTKAKMYKQKGTGNARHGNRRASLFRGGGVTHGPRNVRNYTVGVNKKVMAGALRCALSLRAGAGNLVVVREFTGEKPSTKTLAIALNTLSAPKALVVDDAGNDWLRLSARNLPNADFLADVGVNVYDILRKPKLLISETSLRKLETRLAKAPRPSTRPSGAEGAAA